LRKTHKRIPCKKIQNEPIRFEEKPHPKPGDNKSYVNLLYATSREKIASFGYVEHPISKKDVQIVYK